MATYISRPGDRQSFPGAAGMNTSASRNRLVKFDANGRVTHTTDNDDVVIGVVVDPAINADAGSEVGVITGGMVELVTGSAAAIAVGDNLEPAANGTTVVKGTAASTDRLIALGASSAVGTTIKAFLVG